MRKLNPTEISSKSTLQQSLGLLLRSAEGLFFVSSRDSSLSFDDLDQFRIILDSHAIRFRCGNDGETLTIDDGDLCPSDLGEYGELRRADLSREMRFSILMDTPLQRVFLLKSHEGNYTIGFMLEFDAGSLVICNWGDELKVWDKVPGPLFADEGIQIEPA